MVIETPLLRVSRPVAACSRCRAAKVKCDGKLPACTACERSNRASECSSTNDQFAKGKERSYVATLESRVEKLERKIFEAKERRKSSLLMLELKSSTPSRRASTNPEYAKKVDRRVRRRKEASDIDDLVSDFGLLAVNATARDFYGFTTSMSYATLFLLSATKQPLPEGVVKPLPPKYTVTAQLQQYMHNAFVLVPVLTESSFFGSVEAVYSAESYQAQAFDHWVVRLVLAIASISLSQEPGDEHYLDAIGHVRGALEHADAVVHPGSISSVQAMCLFATYAQLNPLHFDCWAVVGAASRAMVDLGLHQEPARNTQISKTKLDLRRRVYYCVYCMDRVLSLSLQRSFSFSDESANVQQPFAHRTNAPSMNPAKSQLWLPSMDASVEHIRLRELQSGWYHTLYQCGREPWADPYPYIWSTYQSLTDWYETMSTNVTGNFRLYFELNLLYSYIMILSPNARCPTAAPYARRLIFEHGLAYASKLAAVISDSSDSVRTLLTVCDAMEAFNVARRFVSTLLWSQDEMLSSAPPEPPAPTAPTEENMDPMDPSGRASVPPLPIPIISIRDRRNGDNSDGKSASPRPAAASMVARSSPYSATESTSRSIAAIDDFTASLSYFGTRFGLPSLHDSFHQMSAPLLQQLYERSTRLAQQQQQTQDLAAAYINGAGSPYANPLPASTTVGHPMNAYNAISAASPPALIPQALDSWRSISPATVPTALQHHASPPSQAVPVYNHNNNGSHNNIAAGSPALTSSVSQPNMMQQQQQQHYQQQLVAPSPQHPQQQQQQQQQLGPQMQLQVGNQSPARGLSPRQQMQAQGVRFAPKVELTTPGWNLGLGGNGANGMSQNYR